MQTMTLRHVESATHGQILRGDPDLVLSGISTDTRTLRPGELFFALRGERHDAHGFLDKVAALSAGAAVVHDKAAADRVPGLPLVLVAETTRALGDLARWHRGLCPVTVIGITGSNGKTTVKEMLFHILDGVVRSIKSICSYNNAIGVPLTLFQLRPGDVYAVVEIGTNSPGEISRLCEIADPDLGVLTNVAPTHLKGLGSIQGVAHEKSALLKHTVRKGGAFYNADDFWSRSIAKSLKGSVRSYAIENEAEVRGFNLRSDTSGIRFKIVAGPRRRIEIPVLGAYNAMNALAAIAVVRKLGIDWDTIADRLATFKLPPQRMQAATAAGVLLIDDAFNANPVSMEAAVQTFERMETAGRKFFVAADMLELGADSAEMHRKLGKVVAGAGLDGLFGIGPDTAELVTAAGSHGMDAHHLHLAATKDELADALLAALQPGDTVLFKGSHSMALNEVIQLIQKGLGRADDAAQPGSIYGHYRSHDETRAGTPEITPGARTTVG